jgi:ribosomal protein L11 methyltransferase
VRELVLRLPAQAVDEVLDRILLLAAGGVREAPLPDGRVELRLRGDDVPQAAVIAAAMAPWPPDLTEATVPDDWRERRLADYRADVLGGRLIVRPPWAPPAPPGAVDIVLRESGAFGAGTHPTTRACLGLLLEMEPGGSFADLGCGNGVLAILAALRGWAPVHAVDVDPASVAEARHNAAANAVDVDARTADLLQAPAPAATAFAANIPAAVHRSVTDRWRQGAVGTVPATGLISGFGSDTAAAVLAGYRACGLRERRRLELYGWVVAELGPG